MKNGKRRRIRKVKVEAKHGGESCEEKYPDEYNEEKLEPCDSGTNVYYIQFAII